MVGGFPTTRRVITDVLTSGWENLAPGVAEACTVLKRHGLAGDTWFSGEPPGEPITLAVDAVAAYLRRVAAARAQSIPAPCLLISGPLVVVVEMAQTAGSPAATLWFTLPIQLPPVDSAMSLVREVAEALGAYHAHVEDDQLLIHYQSRRATQRARAAVPPEYLQYVPDPPEVPGAGSVPELLVPQEYDARKVPAGVWWVNYWDRVQVQTIGEQRVHDAPWARLVETADGAFVLAATDDPLDPTRPDHVARLRELLDELHLREAQERYCDGSS